MQAVLAAYDWSRFGRRVSGDWPAVDESQKNIRVRDPVAAMMTFRGISRSAGAESRLVAYSESRVCVGTQHSLRSIK